MRSYSASRSSHARNSVETRTETIVDGGAVFGGPGFFRADSPRFLAMSKPPASIVSPPCVTGHARSCHTQYNTGVKPLHRHSRRKTPEKIRDSEGTTLLTM